MVIEFRKFSRISHFSVFCSRAFFLKITLLRGLKKWVQTFNVLRLGTDNSITAVALNVLAVQQSTTQFVDVAGNVTIGE